MRRLTPFVVLLLATSCGQPAQQRSDQGGTPTQMVAPPATQFEASDGAESPAARMAAGPNVGVTAAPGVAFNYRYAFRLQAERIAGVQEHHAQACERLGVARCRITGMRYRVASEDDIEGMLAFKLDPAIARSFGRDGVAAVTGADGMLTESEISGTDVGTSITRTSRNIAEMEEELRRIEARLRAGGLSSRDRAGLESQAQQLRQSITANRQSREQQQESLATTPMVFNYGSGDLVPGPGGRPSLKAALDRAFENFLDGGIVLLVVLMTLLPWALLVGLVWWAVRRVVRRRAVSAGNSAPAPAEATS